MGSAHRMGVLAQFVGKGKFPKKGPKCARTLIIPLLPDRSYCEKVSVRPTRHKILPNKMPILPKRLARAHGAQ